MVEPFTSSDAMNKSVTLCISWIYIYIYISYDCYLYNKYNLIFLQVSYVIWKVRIMVLKDKLVLYRYIKLLWLDLSHLQAILLFKELNLEKDVTIALKSFEAVESAFHNKG